MRAGARSGAGEAAVTPPGAGSGAGPAPPPPRGLARAVLPRQRRGAIGGTRCAARMMVPRSRRSKKAVAKRKRNSRERSFNGYFSGCTSSKTKHFSSFQKNHPVVSPLYGRCTSCSTGPLSIYSQALA